MCVRESRHVVPGFAAFCDEFAVAPRLVRCSEEAQTPLREHLRIHGNEWGKEDIPGKITKVIIEVGQDLNVRICSFIPNGPHLDKLADIHTCMW